MLIRTDAAGVLLLVTLGVVAVNRPVGAGQLDKLLASVPGRRNDDLNGSAYALGRVAATGALDPQAIRDELLSAALQIGLGRREAERTIESGLTAGLQRPRR